MTTDGNADVTHDPRIYLESDDARAAGEWRKVDMDEAREDVDAGMRLVVYLLFGAGFGLGMLLLAGAWALLLR